MYFGSEFKVLLVGTDQYSCYGGDPPIINIKEMDCIQDLISHLKNYFHIDAVEALLKIPGFVDALKAAGWKDVNKINDVEEKLKLGKRFFVVGEHEVEIDPNDLSYNDISELTRDDVLFVQTVDKSCLKKINPKAYKQVLERKRKDEELKKKKIEKKKQREIKKAKKLLERHGEII